MTDTDDVRSRLALDLLVRQALPASVAMHLMDPYDLRALDPIVGLPQVHAARQAVSLAHKWITSRISWPEWIDPPYPRWEPERYLASVLYSEMRWSSESAQVLARQAYDSVVLAWSRPESVDPDDLRVAEDRMEVIWSAADWLNRPDPPGLSAARILGYTRLR